MDTKNEIKEEYEELMAQLDKWESEAADATDEKYKDIREKRDAARSMWDDVKDTADEAWDDVKDGIRKALDELKEAYKDITR